MRKSKSFFSTEEAFSAQNRNRTCTSLRTADFESAASTNSAIWAALNWGCNITLSVNPVQNTL